MSAVSAADIMRERHGPYGKDIREPELNRWPDDGGARVEQVWDENFTPPRLVRRVGWRQCMTNKRHRFFSEDIARVRMCEACKGSATDKSSYG